MRFEVLWFFCQSAQLTHKRKKPQIQFHKKGIKIKNMETNLNTIKKLSKQKWDENWEFRYFLKGYDISLKKLDSIVHRHYEQVSAQIDCTQCANCCKEVHPILNRADIKNFSTGLGISTTEFQEKYLTKDDESQGFIFRG